MKGYPDSDPAKKSWSRPYIYEGYPRMAPVHCTRCGEYQYDEPPRAGASGKMCDDCVAISHMFAQRKHRGSP